MSSTHNQKHKTGIPVLKITHRNGCGDGDVPSAQSQETQESQSQSQLTSKCQKRDGPLVKPVTSSHPAKLTTAKKNKCPETWADEQIQSQSQKLRNSSQSDSRRRKDDMEKHLHEAEAQLVTMGKLLEQREKLMKEAAEEASKKSAELEQKLITQDGHLIKHGIDPVTGMQITLDEEGEKKVESTRKFTKKKVQEMKSKLQEMNSQAESYLSDIENTMQFLNSLEAAMGRAGQSLGDILQGYGDSDFEGYQKHLEDSHHQQIGSGLSSVIRAPLMEKRMEFDTSNINFTVNDDSSAKCLIFEDQSTEVGNVNSVVVEDVEEKIV